MAEEFTREEYQRAGFHIHDGIEERIRARQQPGGFAALSEPEKHELFAYEQQKRDAENRIRRGLPLPGGDF